MSTHAAAPSPPLTAALVWLGLAIAVGASGVLAKVPSPGPQLVILALGAATVAAGTLLPGFRAWVDGLDLRLLVAPHAIRLVAGVVFLFLASQGRMSPLFARNAGWGDIVAATLGLAVIATGAPLTAGRRLAYLVWNVVGVLDFVVVLGTAAVVARRDPASLGLLFHLPLSLVPTFIVPLLIASHVFVFRRLATARTAA